MLACHAGGPGSIPGRRITDGGFSPRFNFLTVRKSAVVFNRLITARTPEVKIWSALKVYVATAELKHRTFFILQVVTNLEPAYSIFI